MSIRIAFVTAVLVAAGALAGCQSSDEPAGPGPQVAATAAVRAHDAPAPTPLAEAAPAVPVLEQTLAYGERARNNLVGYLAMPGDAAEPLPGIIVIHEWWGLNDDVKAMTRRLAGEGYVALAVDLYDGKTAATPEAAQALMTALIAEPDAASRNLSQAYDYLEKYALAPRIASVGTALGGGYALQAALLHPDTLDAVVMYYGQPITDPQRLRAIEVPILAFFGGLDESIPVRQVQDFRAALQELGKSAEVLIYPQVNHGFANPSDGNYNEAAATESWQMTLAFLARRLKLSTPTQPQ